MLTLINIPLPVLNRALRLYGLPERSTEAEAIEALEWAKEPLEPRDDGLMPLALAVAEHMSGGEAFEVRARE